MFTMTSRLLHVFTVKHALDAHNRAISVSPDKVRTGLIMAPEPFKAAFEYRRDDMKELLHREFKENVEMRGDTWWE